METSATFGGLLINEAEYKIQCIKFIPSHPYDSQSPVNITIPGNSSK